MRRRMVFVVGIVFSTLSYSARADQVGFMGQTTANAKLIQDALHTVLVIAQGRLNCSSTKLVTAEIMPPGYMPFGPKLSDSVKLVYERWTVAPCGNNVPFYSRSGPLTGEQCTEFRTLSRSQGRKLEHCIGQAPLPRLGRRLGQRADRIR